MRFHTLDNLPPLSALWLGGLSFGSQMGEKESFAMLDRFTAASGNVVDTAHVYGAWAPNGLNGGYGNSEAMIGRWLRSNGGRKDLVIATKGGHPDFDTAESRMNRADLLRELSESLERLGTNSVDLYFLHRDDRSIPVEEILGWLEDACTQGLISRLACSNWRDDRLQEAREIAVAKDLPLLAMNQISGSLAEHNELLPFNKYGEQVGAGAETYAFHERTKIPVAFYQSQAGGLFARLDAAGCDLSEFPRPVLLKRFGNDLTYARHRAAARMAREKGCTTQQIALAWLLNQPFPAFPIIGASTAEQLDESLRASEISLSADEMLQLTRGDT